MRRLLAVLGGLLLSAVASAAITYAPAPWKLYRSGIVQTGDHASAAACDAALRAQAVAVGRTVTFRCQQSVVARGVADPLPPVDCVVGEWGAWIPGEWSACLNGQRSREETRERDVLVDPANGGAACPIRDENRVVFEACVMPPPAGSVRLSWEAPTTRADGSPLTNLAGYRIRYGTTPGTYPIVVEVNQPTATSYTVLGLAPATWYFALTAVDAAGVESVPSAPVSKRL